MWRISRFEAEGQSSQVHWPYGKNQSYDMQGRAANEIAGMVEVPTAPLRITAPGALHGMALGRPIGEALWRSPGQYLLEQPRMAKCCPRPTRMAQSRGNLQARLLMYLKAIE